MASIIMMNFFFCHQCIMLIFNYRIKFYLIFRDNHCRITLYLGILEKIPDINLPNNQ